MTSAIDGSAGTLFPRRLPVAFRRVAAGAQLAELVQWWWLSEWSLPPGESSQQHLLAFPASNLAVEDSLVGLSGPTTRASVRVLRGTGWVVGALLRPAALAALAPDPRAIRNQYPTLPEPELHAAVVGCAAAGLEAGIAPVEAWLAERVGPVGEEALLANRMVTVAGTDPLVRTVGDLAAAVHVSQRTLHRLADRYVGLTPYALIRRRRLQEAARDIREQPEESLAAIASRHDFTDQAHLAREFTRAIGYSPTEYRRRAGRPA